MADLLQQAIELEEKHPEAMPELDALLVEMFDAIIEYANKQTNYIFKEAMDARRAMDALDAPGWGLPAEVVKIVEEFNPYIEAKTGERLSCF